MTSRVPKQRGGERIAGNSRHRGREAAVQMLYLWEVGRTDIEQVVENFWSIEQSDDSPLPGDRTRQFATALARGTVGSLERIDHLIAGSSEHWRRSRMGTVDRLIIRLAVYEMLNGETPAAVAIDEALDLARTFSTEDAVRFVNGMLDGIRRGLEAQPASSAAAPAVEPEQDGR